MGVLLNTNFGARRQFRLAGRPLGPSMTLDMPARHTGGSCIGVVATDLPLHPAQLRRLAHRVPRRIDGGHLGIEVLVEGQFWTHGSPLDDIFDAVAKRPRRRSSTRCAAPTR